MCRSAAIALRMRWSAGRVPTGERLDERPIGGNPFAGLTRVFTSGYLSGIALFVFLTTRTTFGRRVYAMGGNEKAAKLSGINTERMTLMIFVTMGALAVENPAWQAPIASQHRYKRGVAFHAKPAVAAAAHARVDHGDLTALLFAQGYRREEFAHD